MQQGTTASWPLATRTCWASCRMHRLHRPATRPRSVRGGRPVKAGRAGAAAARPAPDAARGQAQRTQQRHEQHDQLLAGARARLGRAAQPRHRARQAARRRQVALRARRASRAAGAFHRYWLQPAGRCCLLRSQDHRQVQARQLHKPCILTKRAPARLPAPPSPCIPGCEPGMLRAIARAQRPAPPPPAGLRPAPGPAR